MKRIIAYLAAAALLTGCASADQQRNDNKVDDFRKAPISEAFSEIEMLHKKTYNKFTLPKEIKTLSLSKAYELSSNTPAGSLSEETVKTVYKAFYKDKYSEAALVKDEHGGLLYRAGDNDSSYWGHDLYLVSEDYLPYVEAQPKHYDSYSDSNESVELSDSLTTVGELSERISRELNDLLKPIFGSMTVSVEELDINADDVYFVCSLEMEGIPFQYCPSAYNDNDINGSMVYWSFSSLNGVYSADGFRMINAAAPINVTEKQELNDIVPLTEAVSILDRELANNIKLEFTDIALMYCCLTYQPTIDRVDPEKASEADKMTEEYNLTEKKYVPMWCFRIAGESPAGTEYVKVNAVTGELFMDVRR